MKFNLCFIVFFLVTTVFGQLDNTLSKDDNLVLFNETKPTSFSNHKIVIPASSFETKLNNNLSSTLGGGARTQSSKASRSELGFMLGASFYLGELNRMGFFKQMNYAGGLIFRYNLNSRLAFRSNAFYGNVQGDDSKSKTAFGQNRNLSFKSVIVEVAAGIEFNYYQYNYGKSDKRHSITSYMFVELGGFYMNPKTRYNGAWVALQPLGTEGQGGLSGKKPYSLIQMCIPFGLGLKFNMGKRVAMSFEYGMRLTFTDYIDDVSGVYVDKAALATANSPLAANLSDRSHHPLGRNGSDTGSRRGDPNNKDWYSFFGMMLTFQLGKPGTCWRF